MFLWVREDDNGFFRLLTEDSDNHRMGSARLSLRRLPQLGPGVARFQYRAAIIQRLISSRTSLQRDDYAVATNSSNRAHH